MKTYIEKALAHTGIIQLICLEKHLNVYLGELKPHATAMSSPMRNADDYLALVETLRALSNATIVVPFLLQKGHELTDDLHLGSIQVIRACLEKLNSLCTQRSIKLVAVSVVPNDYSFEPNTVIRATIPVSEITAFITSHLAYLTGDESIVIRDKRIATDTTAEMYEKLKGIARKFPNIKVITAKEIKHDPMSDLLQAAGNVFGDLGDELILQSNLAEESGEGVITATQVKKRTEGVTFWDSKEIYRPPGVFDYENIVDVDIAEAYSGLNMGLLGGDTPFATAMVTDLVGGEPTTDVPIFTIDSIGSVPLDNGDMALLLPNGDITPIVKSGPYESPRGIMLLDQTPSDKPILTGENYDKWYDLYLLHPDGTVEGVTKAYDMDDCKYETGCTRIDHFYHPEIFNKMCGKHGWWIGQVAIEVAAGRWAINYHEQFDCAQYMANEPEEC